jgi:hypothetical protein
MKSDFGKAINEDKPQLAVIKRLDELPSWKKAVDKTEQKIEYVFELKPKKKDGKKNKKKPGKNLFKNWNLPLQPQGYLKPRTNDLL